MEPWSPVQEMDAGIVFPSASSEPCDSRQNTEPLYAAFPHWQSMLLEE